jgi:hypothetical protein
MTASGVAATLWPLSPWEVEEMRRQSPNAGIGGRTQQAGTLVAATVMPITFQPTLMPRSALD